MHDIYRWWEIAPFDYINDEKSRNELHEKGFYISHLPDAKFLEKLQNLYKEQHQFSESGMFNTMYSPNIEFRKKINSEISSILSEYLNTHFTDYKVVYSVFFLKGPSTNTFLFLHQDLSLVDESKYSTLHLWIPMSDITTENGALCIIEKSHHLYAPYRGMSFPCPTENIQKDLAKYLTPITMKKGEVLAFDPRTIHCSLPNKTKETRAVAILCITPKQAEIEVSFQSPENDKIEIIRQDEDFFLNSSHFIESPKSRPKGGTSLGFADYSLHYYSSVEFEKLAEKFGIKEKNIISEIGDINTKFYRSPKLKKSNFISRILKKFYE